MKVKYIIFLGSIFFSFFALAGNLDKLAEEAYNLYKFDLAKGDIGYGFCKRLFEYKKFSDKEVKDSIFVNLLCLSINYPDVPELEDIELKDKKKEFFTKLWEDAKVLANDPYANVDSIAWECKLQGIVTDNEALNNIDFVCVARELLKTILNDYSKAGVYVAYGGFDVDDNFKKWERDFFVGTGEICEDSYLNSSNDSKEYCKHEKTYEYVKMVKGSLKQLLKSFKLLKIEEDTDIYDKLLKGENKFVTLVNKMYLEYYFYALFINYYTAFIQVKYDKLQTKVLGTSYENLAKLNTASEIKQAKIDKLTFTYSIKRTLLYMKNIYWTFPIHVGFLAIIEDFKKLRKHLAWIYTPIDQLRYKLENAQDEDKK